MDIIAILVAKVLSFFAGLCGKGTNAPGRIALKISNTVLKTLGKRFKIILVTGTNGKTTTCALLTSILRHSGKKVVTNESGANLKNGVTACLANAYPLFDRTSEIYAVLEIDEAWAKHVTADVSPKMFAVTNIFRDQIDRYGTVDQTLAYISEAFANIPDTILVLNGDDPMLNNLAPENRRITFGFNVPLGIHSKEAHDTVFCKNCSGVYDYAFTTFAHLGNFACSTCGTSRPKLDVSVSEIVEITSEQSKVVIGSMPLTIPQPGAYNIYNALCAVAAAAVLGAGEADIQNGILNQPSKFGRQETVKIGAKELRLILVKNPAGAMTAINSVLSDTSGADFGVLLNDNLGDGTDVSWIYDVEFEKLSSLNFINILVGGPRVFDMAVRLKCSGFDTRKFLICEDFETLLYNIETTCQNKTYLFVTYSAMTELRKFLHKKGFIKKLWN